MNFSGNEMDEIVNDFITESSESLDALGQKFIELEKNPGSTGLLNDIFRSVHTIKGAAGFLGFQTIVEVTHLTEDVMNRLRKGEMKVDPLIMDAILESIDLIKILIRKIKEKSGEPVDIQGVTSALGAILKASEGGAGGAMGAGAKAVTPQTEGASSKPGASSNTLSSPQDARTDKGVGASSQEKGHEHRQTAGGVGGVEPQRPSADTQEPKEAPGVQAKAGEGHAREKEQSIRVDIERLDSVMNLIGELVLSRNRLMMLGGKLSEWNSENEVVGNMDEAIGQLDLVTADLQLAVMKMRMQPIAKVFNKFPRMVRDLARQNGKEVELLISGEETELDKTVIEEIGDPLVHLIRNAVDHGIEPPEERTARGKPGAGVVKLSAYQEGQHIIVSVADDGKGIDPADIKRSAVEKGVLSPEEADKMGAKDAMNLIFIPGFSTAKTVSNISGRGVGMDVVKTNITRINGTINIESEPGKGSRIVFRLPLTLAIIQVLTVKAGEEIFGIPLSMVVENIRLRSDEIRTVGGREVVHIRDRVFPVVRLDTLVKGSSRADGSGWKYVVIIGAGEKTLGVVVDRLRGQEEIVMKSMGEYLKGTKGTAGACINGEGSVILILDVSGLLEASENLAAC